MIDYKKFKLDNGLRLIVHEDDSTAMAAVNVLYDVGARDEMPDKTGFAHLFEHLMFGGSVNIKDFDGALQAAGGTNNAFTTSDITNYYDLLPAINLETALWLESDRMLGLNFCQQALDVQKKVVSEEFKEHYLNQPYGEVWHKLLSMSFTKHPYGWPVIGKNLQHIDNFVLDDVKAFFKKHYCPNNAIITIAGGVKALEVLELVKKWFGDIPKGEQHSRYLPVEPSQTKKIIHCLEAEVPLNALYITFKFPGRLHKNYYAADFISDILSNGWSSRLYQSLIKEKQLFSKIHAYVTATIDPGLLYIEGKLHQNIAMETAEKAVWEELDKLKTEYLTGQELVKVKHKIESHIAFSQTKILTRAIDLSYFELLGNTELINTEATYYNNLTKEAVKKVATQYLRDENACTLKYYATQN